ncbi:MAG: hypothetical protein BJ554DRAFT_7912 [Olpidium bornovanus]|uniref:Uncharacterized protein n=1 Tax=Olpidium bornovanus TaxID=278681 RepID=A0A8H7ZVR9_9FUNG|nr:MAG: hypothetical protein BJ554DRAFT_7912 [Olpidium bornovanus]
MRFHLLLCPRDKTDRRFHFAPEADEVIYGASAGPPFCRRFTLVADIQPDDGIPAFQLYSAHLEIFCGLSGRVAQISDLLHDAATHAAPPPPLSTRAHLVPRQALFGDLNTSAHGIARLSPRLCRDSFRWRTLGTAESLWVDECVFAFHVLQGEKNVYLEKYRLPELFPEIVLRHARNPGFVDPWHPTRDITLRSRSYMSLYQAKLDWTLLRGFDVVGQLMGNHDYSASDHKYLLVDVVPSRDDEPVNGGEAGAGEARGLGNGIGGNVSPTAAAKEVVRFQARRLEALRRRRRMLDVLDEEGGLLGTRAARVFVGAATAAVLVIGMWFLQRKRK